jgi:hypothetical protein
MNVIVRIFAFGIIFSLAAVSPLQAQSNAEPLIRNNLQVKAILKENSPIYQSASTSSSVVEEAKQFSFFFVFQPGIAANDFYYVGKEPRRALGWIQKPRVMLWDHRECVKFTPIVDRMPARVYGSLDAVKTSLEYGSASRVQGIAEEPEDIANQQFAMLLPVLSRRALGAGNGALEVAFLSANLPESMVQPNPGSNHNYASSGTNYLDILFVLDTTVSMSPYIDGTKEIIDRITQKISEMREGGVKVGLLCYRDNDDKEYVTKWFSPLTTNLRSVQDMLKNQVRVGVNNRNVSEAVFDGLYTGITETRWSAAESGLHVIILVGDASGHRVGDIDNPHNYTVEQMVETASDKKNRVRIIAMKIVSRFEDDNQIHEEQLKKLAQGKTSADQGSFIRVNISNSMAQDYIERVASAVEVEINRLMRVIDVSRGRLDVINIDRSERAIILKNIVRNTGSSLPQFSSGWIAEKNANDKLQVKPYVFMSRDEMVLTLFYMNVALTMATTPTEMVSKSMTTALAAQTGEQMIQGQTLQEHYEKRLGLPVRSRMLAFTLEEIASWSESRRAQLVEYIRNQKKLLEDHSGNPALWFTTGGGFTYTFVPLDYFP